ncbi:dipeptide ABC transporter ATP-binding protein [Amycolatopsis jejuensis]|uniref:dipeptide ABC transporter ATP-binding protein n=1 Tax=Amycolatopsis jejuensis TaxID=330084 RepID=UPI0009FF9B13|nr:ABC transporter ATP-binding protein [Amycolatopsis jejuensis]
MPAFRYGPEARPAASDDALLEVKGLSVRRGHSTTLVRAVDLALPAGSTLGIVGESGSGKSLTARSIVGLLPPGLRATGSIRYQGEELIGKSERAWRKLRGGEISLLMQDPFTMLNPLQWVGTTIAESLPKQVRDDRAKLRREIAARLDEVRLVPAVADRYPFELSGGMRQRVALAAALARDPKVLIADEPTTALDVTTQDEVLALLREIQRSRNMSMLFITHDLPVAFSICSRIQVMYAGSVVELASADRLRDEPAHPYSVGLLLAEPDMERYLDRLVSIPGRVPAADSVAGQCSFAERCAWVRPECTAGRPALVQHSEGHLSACVRVEEIGKELVSALQVRQRPGSPPPTPSSRSPILVVDQLRKTFHTTPLIGRGQQHVALDGVSFSIGERESLGLVGETGSGKTTIARSILGLTTPDSGEITLGGMAITDRRKLDRRERREVYRSVQVVFQDPYASLNPARSVETTLREVIGRRGDSDDSSREARELLVRVGLPESYLGRRPDALSGGERQRIAIARAIAMKPRLLICDEPVAALDVSAQAQVLELLRDIRRDEGIAMLFITHDLSVVRQMTDRVMVLCGGEIVESGDTPAVLDHPSHRYTQRLVAAVPGSTAKQ